MWADWWRAHKLTVYFDVVINGVVLLAVIAVLAAVQAWLWWRARRQARTPTIWYLLDLYDARLVNSYGGSGDTPPPAAVAFARGHTDRTGHTTALVVLRCSFQADEGPATRALEDKR